MKNEFKYSPFGESPAPSGSTFGFTGQRYDAETGLYYFKARYYSPSLGRFLQTDPIGYRGGGLNLYTYGLNDPLNKPDPSGLAPTSTTTSSYDLGSLLSPGGYDDQSDDDGGSNSDDTSSKPDGLVPGQVPDFEPPPFAPWVSGDWTHAPLFNDDPIDIPTSDIGFPEHGDPGYGIQNTDVRGSATPDGTEGVQDDTNDGKGPQPKPTPNGAQSDAFGTPIYDS